MPQPHPAVAPPLGAEYPALSRPRTQCACATLENRSSLSRQTACLTMVVRMHSSPLSVSMPAHLPHLAFCYAVLQKPTRRLRIINGGTVSGVELDSTGLGPPLPPPPVQTLLLCFVTGLSQRGGGCFTGISSQLRA